MMPRPSAYHGPNWRRAAVVVVSLAIALCVIALSRTASAHPAGFTSINRYLGVACEDDGLLRIAYMLDFAEMPSYSEIELLDADHDGAVSPDEQRTYLDRRLPPLIYQWEIEVDGERVVPHVVASSLEIRDGEQGLSIVRIVAEVDVDAALGRDAREAHVDVRDRVFSDRSGWREMAADDSSGWAVTSGPKEEPSKALDYAVGRRVPRVDEASFVFQRAISSSAGNLRPKFGLPFAVDPRLARLSRAIREASGSGSFSAIALALALALGAAHALSPGHGKALAAAYLAGSRARPSQAVIFGTTVTVAHTAVVFAVGSLAVAIEHTVGSDLLMRALELLAAVTVLVLGAVQLARHWRNLTAAAPDHEHSHVGGGGGGDVRSVLALGASAGLTPCPSALAMLLTAVAVHRYGFGLILVLAFSAGIAGTLTATGLLMVFARRVLDRISPRATLLRWLPILSSVCMLVIGVVLCASAL
jgi:nickel/cobalt transporter (NicO) family protein